MAFFYIESEEEIKAQKVLSIIQGYKDPKEIKDFLEKMYLNYNKDKNFELLALHKIIKFHLSQYEMSFGKKTMVYDIIDKRRYYNKELVVKNFKTAYDILKSIYKINNSDKPIDEVIIQKEEITSSEQNKNIEDKKNLIFLDEDKLPEFLNDDLLSQLFNYTQSTISTKRSRGELPKKNALGLTSRSDLFKILRETSQNYLTSEEKMQLTIDKRNKTRKSKKN